MIGEISSSEAFGGLVEHALRLLGLLEQVGDLRERGDARDEALAEQARDLVEHHQAARVRDRDDQAVFPLLNRHEVIAEHHVHRHGAEQIVLDAEVLEVDELATIATRERLRVDGFVELKRQRQYRGFGHGENLVYWWAALAALPSEKMGR
jgi:hypothetical protein